MFFYARSGLSHYSIRDDVPQINAGRDSWRPLSDPTVRFEARSVAGCNVGFCVVGYDVFGQVLCRGIAVSETRQKILLWVLLPVNAPRSFGTSFRLAQTSYCMLYEEVARLPRMTVYFSHAYLESTCCSISSGLDCLKQDHINHHIAGRTPKSYRSGNKDPSVRTWQTMSPFHTSWSHSSEPCECWDGAARGRCGGRRHCEGTRSDHHRLDSLQSANCKHIGCPRLIRMYVWVYMLSGRYIVPTAQDLAWPSRSRTALGHARGMQGRAGHEHMSVSPTELANDYSNTTPRSDKG